MWGFGSSICSKGPLVQIYSFVDHRGSQFWRDWTNDYGSLSQIPKVAKLPVKKKKKGKLTFLALVNNRQRLCIIGLPAPKLVLPATHSAENNGLAHNLLSLFSVTLYLCKWFVHNCNDLQCYEIIFVLLSLFGCHCKYVWDAEVCGRIMDTGCYVYCVVCIYFDILCSYCIYCTHIVYVLVVGCGGVQENNGRKAETHCLLFIWYIFHIFQIWYLYILYVHNIYVVYEWAVEGGV